MSKGQSQLLPRSSPLASYAPTVLSQARVTLGMMSIGSLNVVCVTSIEGSKGNIVIDIGSTPKPKPSRYASW
eukprot:1159765-Pelagomonas_calceolata.AAC.4